MQNWLRKRKHDVVGKAAPPDAAAERASNESGPEEADYLIVVWHEQEERVEQPNGMRYVDHTYDLAPAKATARLTDPNVVSQIQIVFASENGAVEAADSTFVLKNLPAGGVVLRQSSGTVKGHRHTLERDGAARSAPSSRFSQPRARTFFLPHPGNSGCR